MGNAAALAWAVAPENVNDLVRRDPDGFVFVQRQHAVARMLPVQVVGDPLIVGPVLHALADIAAVVRQPVFGAVVDKVRLQDLQLQRELRARIDPLTDQTFPRFNNRAENQGLQSPEISAPIVVA